jgi:hypothetical protein
MVLDGVLEVELSGCGVCRCTRITALATCVFVIWKRKMNVVKLRAAARQLSITFSPANNIPLNE